MEWETIHPTDKDLPEIMTMNIEPLSEEQINTITDAEFEYTDEIYFLTPKGKKVYFHKHLPCHLCTKWHPREATDFGYCEHWGKYTEREDFCSYGATTT